MLAGKKVLIVDDDIRNIFAMTSLLEPHKMNILSAETGRGAIEILQDNGDIDVVLMDIMMPDMDGYDTMRAIRKLAKFRSLPIIALTAKAMKGDREKCIEAGASRLHHQAGRHRAASGVASGMAVPVRNDRVRRCRDQETGSQSASRLLTPDT